VVYILSGLCGAAEAGTLEDALRRCAAESDDSSRLACFDSVTRSLPRLEQDSFGLTADIKRKRDPIAVAKAKDETLSGRIAVLRQTAEGKRIFTLDNGQVWIESELRPSIEFTAGEAVRIEQGAVGSLWLGADRHRKVRVKRLQ
jgi:hypothetical protein